MFGSSAKRLGGACVAARQNAFYLFVFSIIFAYSSMQTNSAYANAQQCAALKQQIASANRGPSPNFRKYDQAANRQASEISRATSLLEANNCGFGGDSRCSALRQTIGEMKRNYRTLVRRRDSFESKSAGQTKKLKARFAALRCDEKPRLIKPRQQIDGLEPLDDIRSGPKTLEVKNRSSDSETPRRNRPIINTFPSGPGNYRTVCVRTCDGYYFPISHTSRSSQFARDETICSALCPAAESKLFVIRNDEDDAEQMMSLAGESYKELPTAFKYRDQARSPTCSCGTANPAAVGISIGGLQKMDEITPENAVLPANVPSRVQLRTDPNADKESQRNAAAGVDIDMIKKFIGKTEEDELELSNADRIIRVVGPEFLPDPTTAIDLQAPGPTSVQ